MREGDLVGVEGIREGFHSVSYLSETNSVLDMGKTLSNCDGHRLID